MQYSYSADKDEFIQITRGFCFNDIIEAIQSGWVVHDMDHPNILRYPNQKLLYVRMRDHIYVIPYVNKWENEIFLKTAYPSRAATKKYS